MKWELESSGGLPINLIYYRTDKETWAFFLSTYGEEKKNPNTSLVFVFIFCFY